MAVCDMNPGGPSEEIGATLRSLIDGLKAQPAVLGLSLMVLALLVFLFYALEGAAKFRERLIDQVLANSTSIQELLKSRAISCPETPTPLVPTP